MQSFQQFQCKTGKSAIFTIPILFPKDMDATAV